MLELVVRQLYNINVKQQHYHLLKQLQPQHPPHQQLHHVKLKKFVEIRKRKLLNKKNFNRLEKNVMIY